jgi:HK97 gp10 family phage protein
MAMIIQGLAQLQTKLTRMQNNRAQLRSAMNQSTALVDGEAKTIVPVDTGALRSSIHASVDETPASIVGKVATGLEYAPHVEFGTVKMGAQPYLFPALQRNRGRIQKLFAGAVKTAVKGK